MINCAMTSGFDDAPAVVPGSIFTDLMRLGRIDDPYYRDNDALYNWVGRSDWLYSKNFTGNYVNYLCHFIHKMNYTEVHTFIFV